MVRQHGIRKTILIAVSIAAFHGTVSFIPCPKEISSVRVHIDRSIESANAE